VPSPRLFRAIRARALREPEGAPSDVRNGESRGERLAVLRTPSGATSVQEGARAVSTSAREESERATVDAPKRLWREGGQASGGAFQPVPRAIAPPRVDRHLPGGATLTVLVSSFPIAEPSTMADVAALTEWLESAGFPVFYAEVDLGSRGRWHRVLAGAYTDPE